MRWNSTCTLISTQWGFDAAGNPVEERTEAAAFCNRFTVGATAQVAARTAGLHRDAEVQLRACDYDGQEALRIDGDPDEYTVEDVSESGDFVRLTLARRATDRGRS